VKGGMEGHVQLTNWCRLKRRACCAGGCWWAVGRSRSRTNSIQKDTKASPLLQTHTNTILHGTHKLVLGGKQNARGRAEVWEYEKKIPHEGKVIFRSWETCYQKPLHGMFLQLVWKTGFYRRFNFEMSWQPITLQKRIIEFFMFVSLPR
jgi:hypothetical protein